MCFKRIPYTGPMKIDTGICSPVAPLYMVSLPYRSKSFASKISPMTSCGDSLFINEVPSPNAPACNPAFPNNCSKFCAIVIRDGIAWGFIIMSGTMPDSVRGISYPLRSAPMVPFWPCLFENLSPSSGMRSCTTRIFTRRNPALFNITATFSTRPRVHTCGVVDASFTIRSFVLSMYPPTITVFSSTYSPSRMIPLSSSLE